MTYQRKLGIGVRLTGLVGREWRGEETLDGTGNSSPMCHHTEAILYSLRSPIPGVPEGKSLAQAGPSTVTKAEPVPNSGPHVHRLPVASQFAETRVLAVRDERDEHAQPE